MAAGRQIAGGYFTAKRHSTTYEYISPLKLDLAGKHVLITGTAWESGVGYATAIAFARAGASAIAVADLHGVLGDLVEKLKVAAAEAGRPEPLVLSCVVDIASQESVQAMYDTVSQRFGRRLDVLVNNAAHMEPYKPLLDSDPAVYWRTWEVNVGGLFNMTRAFLPMLLSTRPASGGLCTIINVASSGALSARPGSGSYRSSKLAILRWTESLQLEYGDTVAWLAAERREWLGGRYVSCPWDMEDLLAKKDEIIEKDMLKVRMVF
ncbi:hypothetical protein VTI74DRAFT_3457 [Chaetomium olivicolor]